jgi:hypothetical protein
MDAEAIAAALDRLFDALAALQRAEIERAERLAEHTTLLVQAAHTRRLDKGRTR